MKIPLVCYTEKDSINIIVDKTKQNIEFPINPTCFIKDGFSGLDYRERPIWGKWIDLWTKEPINVYRKEFSNTVDCSRFFRNNKDGGYIFSLPYLEQVLIYEPDFFFQYPNNESLMTLTFDIEVQHDGKSFPTADTNPIIAIGYKINNEQTKVIDCYDEKNIDKDIIINFLNIIQQYDPDIIVGYNAMGMSGEGFDIPYLIKRAEIHGLNITKLTRWGNKPYYKKDNEIVYNIYGRCVFDVFNFVVRDTSLFGVKNKKLKTISEWYDISTNKFDMFYKEDNSKYIKTEEVRKLVAGDVDATYKLFEIYFPLQKYLAEMMGIPLDNMVNSYASFVPKIFMGRHLIELKMLPFQSNYDRYTNTKFQAALTNMKRQGFHKELWGIDFASYYPSLMVTFNLCYSPDTEVLTNNGWKIFKDVKHNDMICTLNPKNNHIEYINYKSIQSFNYIGEVMYVVNSKQIDLMVTPEHKMYIAHGRSNNFNLETSKYIYNKPVKYKRDGIWIGNEVVYFNLPQSYRTQKNQWNKESKVILEEKKFKMDDWLEFLGYFISEGCTSRYDGQYKVIITQNPSNQKLIKKCITSLGFKFYLYPNCKNITILNKQLYDYLKPLGKCNQKYIPKEFMSLSFRQLKILFNSLMFGDGSYDGIYPRYTTTSKRLADDFQELVFKLGFAATIGEKNKKNGKHLCCYDVYISTKCLTPGLNTRKIKHDKFIEYNGLVWCCTMPRNNIIYVRRNNKPCWSGNSPECVKLTTFLDKKDEFDFLSDGKTLWARIPDENFNCDVLLNINLKKDGFLRTEMDNFFEMRGKIKKSMETADGGQKTILKSQSDALKVLMNCFTEDMQVLTTEGIKYIKDINVNDNVYSINPKTLKLEIKSVTNIYKYKYDGDILNFKSNRVNLSITPEHKLIVSNNFDKKVKFIEAKNYNHNWYIPTHLKIKSRTNLYINLLDYIKDDVKLFLDYNNTKFNDLRCVKTFLNSLNIKLNLEKNSDLSIKKICKIQEKVMTYEILEILYQNGFKVLGQMGRKSAKQNIFVYNKYFSKIIGYYVSEGCLLISTLKKYKNKISYRGITHRLNFAQDYKIHKKYYNDIKKSLDMLDLNYSANKDGLTFCSDIYYNVFKNLDIVNKRIKFELLNILNIDNLWIGLYNGDGTKGRNLYSTKYKNLCEDIMQLLLRLGYKVKYRIEKNIYRISYFKNNNYIKKENILKKHYNGYVYNLTVSDNHTVYAGKNGIFCWTGQSIYGTLALNTAWIGEMGTAIGIVGFARWILSEVIKYYGKAVIAFDSVTGQTPIVIRRDKTYIDIIDISSLISPSYKKQNTIRYLWVPKNIEVLTRNGWKKIKYIKKHKVNKKIYRVNTNDGYVEVTEDHSLFLKNRKEIKPKDLKVKDEIEISNIPYNKLNVDISNNFAWFLGFLMAEGGVYLNTGNRIRYSICINNQNLKLLKKCNNIFKLKYLQQMCLYNTMDSSNVYKLELDNKEIALNLYNMCYTRSGYKKVPECIINAKNNIKKSFINGMFSGDGYIKITKKGLVERIDQSHHILLAGIQYIMHSIGDKTSIHIRDDKIKSLSLIKWVGKQKKKKQNKNQIRKIKILSNNKENYVYDISTENGTFICAMGGIVLHNTDGIYIDKEPNIDEINKFVADLIWEKTMVKSKVNFELKGKYSGYFHKTKNYILRDEKGKYIRHGVSIKSSRAPVFYDQIIEYMSKAIIEEKPEKELIELSRMLYSLSQFTLEDFIQRTKLNKVDPELSKGIEENKVGMLPNGVYKNPQALQPFLMKRARDIFNRKLKIGDSVEYYKTYDHYALAEEVNNIKQLDMDYYRAMATKALHIFRMDPKSINDKMQLKLDFWYNEEECPIVEKEIGKKKSNPKLIIIPEDKTMRIGGNHG